MRDDPTLPAPEGQPGSRAAGEKPEGAPAGELRVASAPVAAEPVMLTRGGTVAGDTAVELAALIEQLDPKDHPRLTLDLREATSLDPTVAQALLQAWERRGQERGSVRVLVSPGAVERFFDALGLERAFEIARGEAEEEAPVPSPAVLKDSLRGSVRHYHELLELARARDLTGLRKAAQEAHPICVAVGAKPGGAAFGPWCEDCPLRWQYGGCRPIIGHIVQAAEHGNWDAAQLLIMSLIAEAVGRDVGPTEPGPGKTGWHDTD